MVNAETRTCQNCKNQFTIEPDDFSFYEKISVPPPTWCPECRNMRRFAWREERTLYRGTCSLCKKSIITIHAPGGPFTVYCRPCWWSDKWNAADYGREYDFNQPFFAQYRKLLEAVPRPALTGTNLVNSEYSHASQNCKNCYLVFWSYFSENSQNSFGLLFSRDTYNAYVTDNSDHAYETLHCNRLYRVRFAYFADECLDSSLLFNCLGCSDCFGCVNLRKKKYNLFNQQLSKDEYNRQMAYWDLGSYARLNEAKEKFRTLYLSLPRRYAHVLNSVNVSGDIIRDTKNCRVCFSALDGVEDCKYLYFGGLNLKDSYDVSAGGNLCELLYEIYGVSRGYRCLFSAGGTNSKNVSYTDWAINCSDVFGCVSLRNRQYCILNKQYNREEYEKLIMKIKQQMNDMPYVDRRGRVYRYGEFFPTELSAYAYNESIAFTWYPRTKEEVLNEGWRWQDPPERAYKITVEPENLPDHIRDVSDSILNETIGCLHYGKCNEQCTTAFRLTPEELTFHREMSIALPRLCPNCRYAERLKWRNGFHLWRRKCTCGGVASNWQLTSSQYENTTAHFHGSEPCPNEFETTYSPEKPEITYCDQCYKSEFL